MPGSFTWTGSGGTVGTLSGDTNSFVPVNLLTPEWDTLYPTLATRSRPAGGAEGGYLDTVLLNPYADAPVSGGKLIAFATPPGITSVAVSLPAKLPAGVSSATLVFQVLALNSTTPAGSSGASSAAIALTNTLTTYAITPTGLVGNTEYRVWVQVRSGGTQSQIEAGPLLVTPAAGQTGYFTSNFERYAFTADDFWENSALAWPAGTNPSNQGLASAEVAHQAAGARAAFETTATTLSVECFPYVGSVAAYAAIARYVVFVNGRFYTTLDASAPYRLQHLSLTLPPGRKRVDLLAGVPTFNSSELRPCGLRAVYWHSTDELRVLRPPVGTRALLVYGDDVALGVGATFPTWGGAFALVRQAISERVITEGRAGMALMDDGSSLLARMALARRMGASEPARIWLAVGGNDYANNSQSAAAFGTAYGSLLDLLHTYLPETVIYAQTPILRASEAANGSGNTLGDYRAQITAAAGTRPWVVLVDGTTLVTTGDLAGDGIHPTDQGHERMADAILPILQAQFGQAPNGFSVPAASASTAWAQATLSPRDLVPIDIPCPGAVVGDTAEVSLDSLVTANLDGAGQPITNSVQLVGATVSAAGVVSCGLWNVTSAAVTVPAGTLRARTVRVT